MTLDELKLFLKIDGTEYDLVLPGYQAAAETYLANAGVAKDYANALYKILITVICATFIENPSLVTSRGNLGSLEITLNAMIAQLRAVQAAAVVVAP